MHDNRLAGGILGKTVLVRLGSDVSMLHLVTSSVSGERKKVYSTCFGRCCGHFGTFACHNDSALPVFPSVGSKFRAVQAVAPVLLSLIRINISDYCWNATIFCIA